MMYLHEYGTGERTIVLLHGIPGSARIWARVAGELARDHRVIVPDLIGFGASSRPGSIEGLWAVAQARALGEALTTAGVTRAVVAGHDFGGPVALAFAASAEGGNLVAGVCLAATNVFTDTPIPLPIRAVTWPVVGSLAARVLFSRPSLAMMLRDGEGNRLDSPGYLTDEGEVRSTATIFLNALRELERRYALVESALRGLDVPVLVAWGERDPFFALSQGERTAAAAADARLAVYEGAGHFLPSERPADLARDLRELAGETMSGEPAARRAHGLRPVAREATS